MRSEKIGTHLFYPVIKYSYMVCRARLLLLSALGEALAAQNRSVVAGLERNSGNAAALRAGRLEHLSAGALAISSAFLASGRLVLEPSLRVKLLLTGGEHEFGSAIFAYQGLVFVHVFPPKNKWFLLKIGRETEVVKCSFPFWALSACYQAYI